MATSAKAIARRFVAGVGGLLPARRGVRVLCYHGVCESPTDEWSVTPGQLKAQMSLVARDHVPVTLDDVVDWASGGRELPSNAVAVTFDDGFLDVLTRAAPILGEAGVPGAVFVSTSLASRGHEASDPSFAATRPLLDWGQILELHNAGWTVGSHCMTHPKLSGLSPGRSRTELVESRDEIENRLGTGCRYVAYPYGTPGAVSDRDRSIAAEAGYRAGFMAVTGAVSRGADLYALPRSKVLGTDTGAVVGGTLAGRMDLWARVERTH